MQCYRTLIVDDEPYIVHYLYEMLGLCTEPNLETIAACTAEEAIRLAQRQKIDILLTDIRMPVMSGMEVAKHVLQRWPDCKVLLLTAHAEFELAQQALSMGVFSYILKTSNDQQILHEIRRAAAAIDRELEQSLAAAKEQMTAHVMAKRMQKQWFFNLLHNEGEFNPEDCQQASRELGLSCEGEWILLTARIQEQANADIRATEYAVRLLFSRYVADHLHAHVCEASGNWLYWYILLPRSLGILWLRDTLETFSQACSSSSGIALSLVMCHDIPSPFELGKAYEQSMRHYQRMEINEAGYIYHFAYRTAGVPAESRPAAQTDGLLCSIIQYVEQHVFEDISLQDLADLTGYNPCYLSRLFSERMNETFKTYLARKRMEIIEKMMKDPTLSLRDIANKAHFEDRSYFNRFVKRLTGMTPQQFREHLLE